MSELNNLIEKACAVDARVAACHHSGGHDYTVDGFSRIAHPETVFGDLHVERLSDVTFRSYACQRCGNRVSIQEGRAYMQQRGEQKFAEQEAHEARKELWAQGYCGT